MGMIQLIIGAWTLLMIFVLCFEDCRAYLKNIVVFVNRFISIIYNLNGRKVMTWILKDT